MNIGFSQFDRISSAIKEHHIHVQLAADDSDRKSRKSGN